MRIALAILLISVFIAAALSYVVPQAQAGLVPCGASQDDPSTTNTNESLPCRPCDLFILGNNVFNFLVLYIALPLFILVTIIAGVFMLFGGVSSATKSKARGMLEAGIIGLVIILLSWAIVNTGIVWLTGSQQPQGFPWPWHEPSCQPNICFEQCYAQCVSAPEANPGVCNTSCTTSCE